MALSSLLFGSCVLLLGLQGSLRVFGCDIRCHHYAGGAALLHKVIKPRSGLHFFGRDWRLRRISISMDMISARACDSVPAKILRKPQDSIVHVCMCKKITIKLKMEMQHHISNSLRLVIGVWHNCAIYIDWNLRHEFGYISHESSFQPRVNILNISASELPSACKLLHSTTRKRLPPPQIPS